MAAEKATRGPLHASQTGNRRGGEGVGGVTVTYMGLIRVDMVEAAGGGVPS